MATKTTVPRFRRGQRVEFRIGLELDPVRGTILSGPHPKPIADRFIRTKYYAVKCGAGVARVESRKLRPA